MDKFLTVLAWIFGIGSTIRALLVIIATLSYDELDKLKDELRGYTRRFPLIRPLSLAIICWAWIITR